MTDALQLELWTSPRARRTSEKCDRRGHRPPLQVPLLRQLLLQRFDRLEKIAHFFDALEDLFGRKDEQLRVFLLQGSFALRPSVTGVETVGCSFARRE